LVSSTSCRKEWDKPVLELGHEELQSRFDELENVLGVRRVAEYVRQRQLSHLGRALNAQLDESVLDDTRKHVERLCREALPEIRRNRASLWFETWQRGQRQRLEAFKRLGLDAVAEMVNSPFGVIGAEVDECVSIIREMDATARKTALDRLRLPRTMFSLRVLKLAVALRLVDDPVIRHEAAQTARAMTQAHVSGFADDPLEAASHNFEVALVPFVARATVVAGGDNAVEMALQIRRRLDPHEFVTRDATYGVTADRIIGQVIAAAVRRVWYELEPWNVETLAREASRLRELAERLGPQRKVEPGQVGDPHMDLWLTHDPLLPATRNIVTEVQRDEVLSDLVRAFARDLLAEFFADETT
jgi:hypothetical protein